MNKAILLAALGYFVDIYDLILFSIVRVKSLKGLGVASDQLLNTGVLLLNAQMLGMLIGGVIWGVLADKKGRLGVLLSSIFLYSAANIANAFVSSVEIYALLRFVAGVGLAGELGVGITLVAEVMPKNTRALGTTIVATVGILGAIAAALVGDLFDWRIAYLVGGLLGFALLLLRIKVSESGMFSKLKTKQVERGKFWVLFTSLVNLRKYISSILIGVPLWFVVGILVTFAPEFGEAMGMVELPLASKAVMFAYIGLAIGDLSSGLLSYAWKSRLKSIALFMGLNAALMVFYLMLKAPSLPLFYGVCLMLGFASGYWAVFVTVAAEQFGTNLRATVATTVPNFVRGSVVVSTLLFQWLKPNMGIISSAGVVAFICVVLAAISLAGLKETAAKDLDYVE